MQGKKMTQKKSTSSKFKAKKKNEWLLLTYLTLLSKTAILLCCILETLYV